MYLFQYQQMFGWWLCNVDCNVGGLFSWIAILWKGKKFEVFLDPFFWWNKIEGKESLMYAYDFTSFVVSTHLKNMLIKLDILSKDRGENKKYLTPPPSSCVHWNMRTGFDLHLKIYSISKKTNAQVNSNIISIVHIHESNHTPVMQMHVFVQLITSRWISIHLRKK